ncbi:hypothetical protein OLX02_05985 [Novosphingobium sp. KCTC 2891]|uniref:hypothetical protein n=1 Tax=Novosphingobium sp. KCTC 2891 TaxID=2989730 RepID=UPI00222161DC|nr:hypothetical protein [Novosphingobium sp. KCTC 2891]MCW1382367.1 hypothetical protein [Novosphingobium sp. KCTC 2891]
MLRFPLFAPTALTAAAMVLAPLAGAAAQAPAGVIRAPAAASAAAANPLDLTYADLADLALPADLVARAQVRKVARLKPEQAPGLPAGSARLYVEARTTALLAGPDLGESIRFLADVPLDAKGRVPRLSKADVLVLAHTVPAKPGDLLLVAPDAMLPWSSGTEQRLRAILTEKLAPDAPPAITGLREALHVPGNLAGEGETQLFFATEGGKPVSLSVVRRPGQAATWGVSFSEIVDQAARPPAKDTLGWYRLACALPAQLPEGTNISGSPEDQRIAAEDYAQVLGELGACLHNRAPAAPPVAAARPLP